ncbi:MAG: lipoyl(octanoyl) transferase LipB [Planctomycetota bacterium]|nr:lipoyl(octanoyl) transferase LipB [Planctomycetota bacterium]MEC8252469.1 lipoyl(octanoyl) transferase LipB [Planctomycetota bacterium]MEC8652706.1 lipoyl(octanoyl) transferase LipB [Planctomycetota bacterium]MEC9048747.1 lipoyl(octanoyl) transferase LipB [Planctomycetota bacterium]
MSVEVENIELSDYREVLAAMRARHALVAAGDAAGVVWLVEHDPVYTAGRATPPRDLRDEIVPIERGGQITWHGPGQLTIYPIMKLPRRDVRDWLRRIERFGVDIAAALGLHAEPSVDGTGVFVGGRKFASIGVAVKRWTNLHGIGVNVAVDGSPWQAVRPCGLSPEIMTDLRAATGRDVTMAEVADAARDAVSALTAGRDPV